MNKIVHAYAVVLCKQNRRENEEREKNEANEKISLQVSSPMFAHIEQTTA